MLPSRLGRAVLPTGYTWPLSLPPLSVEGFARCASSLTTTPQTTCKYGRSQIRNPGAVHVSDVRACEPVTHSRALRCCCVALLRGVALRCVFQWFVGGVALLALEYIFGLGLSVMRYLTVRENAKHRSCARWHRTDSLPLLWSFAATGLAPIYFHLWPWSALPPSDFAWYRASATSLLYQHRATPNMYFTLYVLLVSQVRTSFVCVCVCV